MIALVSYLAVFSLRDIRNTRLVALAFLVVITAHHAISVYNFWYWPLPGANLDAFTFHLKAQEAVSAGNAPIFSVGTGIYEAVLYFAYRVFGPCLLVGQTLSVLAAAIIGIIAYRITKFLNVNDERLLALLVVLVGLTPSFLLYTSLTFREPFQLLAFITGVFLSIKAIKEKAIWLMPVSALSFILMGLFHHILMGAAFVLIFVSVLFYLIKHRVNLNKLVLQLGMVSVLIVFTGYWVTVLIPASEGNNYVRILKESGGVVEMIERYRHAVEKNLPRSTFGYSVETTSITGLVGGLLKSYGSYLFGPGPGSIRNNLDIVPFINSMWRILSVLIIGVYMFMRRGRVDLLAVYLSINFLFLTLLWSLGTTNYGQAFRHNAITDWIIAILLVYTVNNLISKRIAGE